MLDTKETGCPIVDAWAVCNKLCFKGAVTLLDGCLAYKAELESRIEKLELVDAWADGLLDAIEIEEAFSHSNPVKRATVELRKAIVEADSIKEHMEENDATD